LFFFEHVHIPKSENRPSAFRHKAISGLVVCAVCVLAAVYLNDQTLFATGEIGEIIPNGKLSNKLISVQSSTSNFLP